MKLSFLGVEIFFLNQSVVVSYSVRFRLCHFNIRTGELETETILEKGVKKQFNKKKTFRKIFFKHVEH